VEICLFLHFEKYAMKPTQALLNQPIKNLGLSNHFMRLCDSMGFEKIADIVAVEPEALIRRKEFTYHWLSELTTFLQKEKALDLLQARLPEGNISG
jgi:hypothetical protein